MFHMTRSYPWQQIDVYCENKHCRMYGKKNSIKFGSDSEGYFNVAELQSKGKAYRSVLENFEPRKYISHQTTLTFKAYLNRLPN